MERFKSKIDIWLVLFLGVIFGGIAIKMAFDGVWGVLFFMSLVIIFIVHMFMTTFYIIEGEKLIIKCGFLINISIAVETIKKISETNNIMSSPALSLDRLEILYNKFDTVMISPKEKIKFIEAIQKINPEVKIRTK
ncbi:PH domain-containing protein [Flavobacterium piscis]|uniref:Energy-coupling factor transporter transmembrane protein EcfT n=1 Tax=Flavobacterium piscis TaxID=1114874 RepID=A0ABU1Y971_9FLAO|nr:PH domain-containing protein [Flavobacterium piscis]MDR7210056.1 energy-coupling factor transporter transmembrane protein EcfT [Flavobacterium piscis]